MCVSKCSVFKLLCKLCSFVALYLCFKKPQYNVEILKITFETYLESFSTNDHLNKHQVEHFLKRLLDCLKIRLANLQ